MPFYQTSMKEKNNNIFFIYTFIPPTFSFSHFSFQWKSTQKSQNTSVLYIPGTFFVEYTIWTMTYVTQCNILSKLPNLFLITSQHKNEFLETVWEN